MSFQRIAAIGFIVLIAGAGWWTLGTTTQLRSSELDSRLGAEVEQLWGIPLEQPAPSLAVEIPGTDRVRWMMPTKNDITVNLLADHRKKGLIWYPTYECLFTGRYTITNDEDVAQKVRIQFDFPAKGGTYDAFSFSLDGKDVSSTINTNVRQRWIRLHALARLEAVHLRHHDV